MTFKAGIMDCFVSNLDHELNAGQYKNQTTLCAIQIPLYL